MMEFLYNYGWLIVYHVLLTASFIIYMKAKLKLLKWDLICFFSDEMQKVYKQIRNKTFQRTIVHRPYERQNNDEALEVFEE